MEPTESRQIERVNLTCGEHRMTVLVPRSIIGGVAAGDLHFRDTSCVGSYYNSTHVRLQTEFDQCETIMEVQFNPDYDIGKFSSCIDPRKQGSMVLGTAHN